MTKKQKIILVSMMELLFNRLRRSSSIHLIVVVDASRKEEAREAAIGLDARWNLLYVVHIERQESVIRIISARKATRKEQLEYEN